MLVTDSKNAQNVERVAASMAIENMFVSKELINTVIELGDDKEAYEKLIQQVVKKYAR